jgi:hypothetical protein
VCSPGRSPVWYTLVGQDKDGNIINPKRADWKAGSAFVTPPGSWHAPYNESGAPAHLIRARPPDTRQLLRWILTCLFGILEATGGPSADGRDAPKRSRRGADSQAPLAGPARPT